MAPPSKSPTPKMYVTYLLNAEFKKTNDRTKPLEIIPGTASPIKNQWIATKPIKLDSQGNRVISKTGKWEQQVLWYSDGTGLLRTLRKLTDTRVVRVKPDVHDICFVPKEICKRSVIAKGVEGWAEPILEFFKKNPFKEQLIKETIILKKHLRKPTPEEKTSDPQQKDSYGNWYEDLASDRAIKAIVVAKIKAIIFLFSSSEYGDGLRSSQHTSRSRRLRTSDNINKRRRRNSLENPWGNC